jgi:sigma-B regulation protein RsbU (phosphoserine phosphatase)
MFVTAWVGVLDIETGTVTFANAGHNPPLRLTRKGKTTDPDFIASRSGPMLAFMDGIAYRQREVSLTPGDSLFLYTDGVTEALDPKNELYGEDRLLVTLRATETPEPESVCTIVRAAVTAFAAGAPQADDITVLAIKYVSRPRVFSRSFQATKEGLGQAAAFLDELLAPSSTLVDDAAKYQSLLPSLQIFLDEIGSNIVRYSGASGFVIDVELTDAPDGIRLVFFDDGTPYDPLTHVDPDTTLSADKRQIGGLGIFMVKKMATSVAYARTTNRNRLTVFKKL